MKHYHTITRSSAIELDARVNQYLDLGWVLIGGIQTLSLGDGEHFFLQAVAWQDAISSEDFVCSTPVYPSLQIKE